MKISNEDEVSVTVATKTAAIKTKTVRSRPMRGKGSFAEAEASH